MDLKHTKNGKCGKTGWNRKKFSVKLILELLEGKGILGGLPPRKTF